MTAPWPHPAPVDDAGAAHLTPGLAMPDIALRSTDGGEKSLARLAGRWIIFIYPWTGKPGLSNPPGWDDIPGAHGSTPEAEGFRDHFSAFGARGWGVFGLSGQEPDSQREFAVRVNLPFALLSDSQGRLRDALRLPTFETGGVTYLRRLTLLIEQGKIAAHVYPVHPPHTHARDMLYRLSEIDGAGR